MNRGEATSSGIMSSVNMLDRWKTSSIYASATYENTNIVEGPHNIESGNNLTNHTAEGVLPNATIIAANSTASCEPPESYSTAFGYNTSLCNTTISSKPSVSSLKNGVELDSVSRTFLLALLALCVVFNLL